MPVTTKCSYALSRIASCKLATTSSSTPCAVSLERKSTTLRSQHVLTRAKWSASTRHPSLRAGLPDFRKSPTFPAGDSRPSGL